MKLTELETFALNAWMAAENLTTRAAAEKVDTNHNSIFRWMKGGAIHAAQHEKLQPFISPFTTREYLEAKLSQEQEALAKIQAQPIPPLKELQSDWRTKQNKYNELSTKDDAYWLQANQEGKVKDRKEAMELASECTQAHQVYTQAFSLYQSSLVQYNTREADLKRVTESVELLSRLISGGESVNAPSKQSSPAKLIKEIERLKAENEKLKAELAEGSDLKRRYDALALAMKAML